MERVESEDVVAKGEYTSASKGSSRRRHKAGMIEALEKNVFERFVM